jgi:hypothetical protein
MVYIVSVAVLAERSGLVKAKETPECIFVGR